ncbi:hypothetical protein B0T09DRAFT_377373 [Sordaria sp. MPI-SDFR-AT-0083]|nr:hypothetical protein B0T09DRAFT_377373 [Sordaria sp. MPI-SDFR-AT-0083]
MSDTTSIQLSSTQWGLAAAFSLGLYIFDRWSARRTRPSVVEDALLFERWRRREEILNSSEELWRRSSQSRKWNFNHLRELPDGSRVANMSLFVLMTLVVRPQVLTTGVREKRWSQWKRIMRDVEGGYDV